MRHIMWFAFLAFIVFAAVVPAAAGQDSLLECAGQTATVDLAKGQTPTEGDDVIVGTEGDDIVHAGAGNDIVCGLGGDDTITDGVGFDEVHGGEGDDTITIDASCEHFVDRKTINPGSNSSFGGLGNDTIISPYEIWGGEGNDSLTLVILDCQPPEKPWFPTARGEIGDDTLTASNQFLTLTNREQRRYHWDLNGGDGNDTLRGPAHIVAGEGDDLIFGSPIPDLIEAGRGNDTVRAGGGDDLVRGGPGDDTLFGNSGRDNISGSSGDDRIIGGPGHDSLHGDSGKDVILGGRGDDRISGGGGSDILRGGRGSNLCVDRKDTVAKTCNLFREWPAPTPE